MRTVNGWSLWMKTAKSSKQKCSELEQLRSPLSKPSKQSRFSRLRLNKNSWNKICTGAGDVWQGRKIRAIPFHRINYESWHSRNPIRWLQWKWIFVASVDFTLTTLSVAGRVRVCVYCLRWKNNEWHYAHMKCDRGWNEKFHISLFPPTTPAGNSSPEANWKLNAASN